jgi:hypothetical protein
MHIWIGNADNDDASIQQLLRIGQALSFKEEYEDN